MSKGRDRISQCRKMIVDVVAIPSLDSIYGEDREAERVSEAFDRGRRRTHCGPSRPSCASHLPSASSLQLSQLRAFLPWPPKPKVLEVERQRA